MKRRLILSLGLVLAFTLVAVPTVAAHGNGHHQKPLPTQIDLPVGFQPEGLTSSPSGKLYVGSVATGAIWAGSSKTGVGAVIVPGMAGRSAAGLHLDWRGRLWVAGASNGTIRVYDPRTGTLLKEYVFPTAGFVNDLVITHTAVYATDSLNQQLLVVPIGKRGKLVDPSKATTRPLTGDLAYTMGFDANGIVAKGRSLILVQSITGLLFKVNPKTGSTKAIDTHGYLVTNGDGLVLWDVTSTSSGIGTTSSPSSDCRSRAPAPDWSARSRRRTSTSRPRAHSRAGSCGSSTRGSALRRRPPLSLD